MKTQSLLIALLLFTIFSCDKKETSDTSPDTTEGKLLKKVISTNSSTGLSTYNFKYKNNLIEEISCDQAIGSWDAVFSYNADNKISGYQFSEYGYTVIAYFKYQDNLIIQTFDEEDSDSIVYTTNSAGEVLKEDLYEFSTYEDDYVLKSERTYEWSGKNVTNTSYTSNGFIENASLTYDDKINPMYFFNGFASKDDYFIRDLFPICFMKNNILSNSISDNMGFSQERKATYNYKNGYPVTMELNIDITGPYSSKKETTTYTYEYY